MDGLHVCAATHLPRDDLTRQIGEIVREIVLDEKLNLNAPEQQAIVDIMLDDMLGLGPLEPLLADELGTAIMVNGPKQAYNERRGTRVHTTYSFLNANPALNISNAPPTHTQH